MEATYIESQSPKPKRRKWSPAMEQQLIDAVNKHGKRWAVILSDPLFNFEDRTNVELKDKWRNIEKASR